MDAGEIIACLKRMEPQLRSAGVQGLSLFGSRARGDHRPDSDIDLLFEAGTDGIDLWTRAEIMAAIVQRLGADVAIDLADRNALFSQVARSAKSDLVKVF